MNTNWRVTSLGQVCSVVAGQSPKGSSYNSNGSGLPFYQGKKAFSEKFIGEPTAWTTQVTKEADSGDILMSVRAPVGPINFATQKICIGRGLAAIKSSDAIDSEYLFYALLYKQPEIRGNEGAVFASINKKQIESILLPLPPLPEQKRIVAILDEAFAGIDAAISNTEKNLANARELFESVLSSTFSGQGQEQRHLEDVLDAQPRNGWSPPAKNHAHSGIPVLTLSSVTGFRFRPEKIKYTSADVDCTRHYWVSNGDLLITRSNTPELVGHVAIANGINVKTIYPDLIMKMSVDPDKALTKYIYYQLRSPELREEIRSRAQGANPTMKKIGKRAVQTLPVAVPPLSVQKAAVSRIDTFGDECESLSLIYKNKLGGLIELKRALLQKAFSGELTGELAEKEMDEAVA